MAIHRVTTQQYARTYDAFPHTYLGTVLFLSQVDRLPGIYSAFQRLCNTSGPIGVGTSALCSDDTLQMSPSSTVSIMRLVTKCIIYRMMSVIILFRSFQPAMRSIHCACNADRSHGCTKFHFVPHFTNWPAECPTVAYNWHCMHHHA